MGTCAATTQDGSPCGNDAMDGSEYCHVHRASGGTATATQAEDEPGFVTMLAGAFLVIFVTYALLRFLLGM